MKYVGLDVHVKATVWCCLDETGHVFERGRTPTNPAELTKLAERLRGHPPHARRATSEIPSTTRGAHDREDILARLLLWKCKSNAASPLRALPDRVASKGKRKVGVVAAARHILKIAYYVMRDGSVYDPTLLRFSNEKETQSSAV